MKNVKLSIIFATSLAAILCCTLVGNNAFAHYNYSSCLDESNGRGHIQSIKWACSGGTYNPDNYEHSQYCTLWLGPTDSSTSTVITANVSKLDGTINATFYGMCTVGEAPTADIWAEDDNGSIATQRNLWRGPWGDPGELDTTINIGKFIEGITPTTEGDYQVYSRKILIWRRHGYNWNSKSNQEQTVTIKIPAPPTTFKVDTSLTSAPSGATKGKDGKYYTDNAKTSFTFTNKMKRNNDGKSGTVNAEWWARMAEKFYESGNYDFEKNSDWITVNTHTKSNVSLKYGDNTFCESIYAYLTIKYDGATTNYGHDEECITIHRYYWATYDAQVVPVVAGEDKSANKSAANADTAWVDGNSAGLRFKHQLKRTNDVDAASWFATARSTGTTNYTSFNERAKWGDSTATSNSWVTEYDSNSTNIDVNAARTDTAADISTYCQILYYYPKVREDRDDWSKQASKTGCVKIRPYKTTFTGSITIQVYINGAWVTYKNGDSVEIGGENIPTDVPVRFTHTVTRSSSDAHGSPNKKKTYIQTSLGSTTGYRSGDSHGTAINKTESGDLGAGESFSKTDSFTTKIYPEQTIKLCQKLTFTNRIWGSDKSTGSVGEYCITLTKKQVNCQGAEYGIKNAKNYLTMQIFKNGSNNNDSGRLDTTKSDEMITWAKPGDDVRYKYTMCAAGELARQFVNESNYTTNYKVETNMSGYLFGEAINDSPYTGTTKTIGTSNTTPGIGPFVNGTESSHKYEYTVGSPSDDTDDMYSCSGNGLSDYYRIHDIRTNNYNDATYLSDLNNCNADDYGNITDVGHSFTQKATWSDVWYENGSAVTGHTGGDATVVGRVNVPYNYHTSVKLTATGGNVLPGRAISTKIQVKIAKRKNAPVQETEYATYSKLTKYQLIQVEIPKSSDLDATTYNDSIKSQEYSITDNSGNAELSTRINYCGSDGISCSVIASDDGKYYNGDDDFHSVGVTASSSANYDVGTKICYIAGIWPSDSHGFADPNTVIDESNQGEALSETGSRWHLSSPSCFTVVKRPTLSVLGGDIYAPAGILGVTYKRVSSVSRRMTGWRNGRPVYVTSTKYSLFGSWSEYGLVSGTSDDTSKGEIKGFASGASLWGGGSSSSSLRECRFSSMTFANAECGDEKLGQVPINTSSSSYPKNLTEQIRTRYTDSNNTAAKTNSAKIGIAGGCVYDPSSKSYVPSGTNSDSKFICLQNGAKYTHSTANLAYIDNDLEYCMLKGNTENSRTAVIEADHTLIIGTNMVYGNITNEDGAGNVPGTSCYKQQYENPSEIPQMIIIADKIVIKDNVTRIDSWLIANEIYTCDPRSGYNAINQAGNKLDNNTVNSENCNSQLTITGPVIAQKLNLFRTGGADDISNYAMPSEIFYLGPESYLWSYNQSTRYSQATTTYQRELPPRY